MSFRQVPSCRPTGHRETEHQRPLRHRSTLLICLLSYLLLGVFACGSERVFRPAKSMGGAENHSASGGKGNARSLGGSKGDQVCGDNCAGALNDGEAEKSCPGDHCNTVLGGLGDNCEDDNDCSSEHCASGVCCDTACTGACETCSSHGLYGICTLVKGFPTDQACREGPCRGTCNGSSAHCVFPGEETTCASASCSEASRTAVTSAVCSGDGACLEPTVVDCSHFACDGNACRIRCLHDGHCIDGALCVDGICRRYEQKRILNSPTKFSPGGGLEAADTHCQAAFGKDGSVWKALLAGGGRRASITANIGDGQLDWVLAPYTEYYNWEGRLIWTTGSVSLLGVEDGARVDLLAPLFDAESFDYPWTGFEQDWTTVTGGTCEGWTVDSMEVSGTFVSADFSSSAGELCATSMNLLCVEQ